MADREEKLRAARDKLEKYRKKKHGGGPGPIQQADHPSPVPSFEGAAAFDNPQAGNVGAANFDLGQGDSSHLASFSIGAPNSDSEMSGSSGLAAYFGRGGTSQAEGSFPQEQSEVGSTQANLELIANASNSSSAEIQGGYNPGSAFENLANNSTIASETVVDNHGAVDVTTATNPSSGNPTDAIFDNPNSQAGSAFEHLANSRAASTFMTMPSTSSSTLTNLFGGGIVSMTSGSVSITYPERIGPVESSLMASATAGSSAAASRQSDSPLTTAASVLSGATQSEILSSVDEPASSASSSVGSHTARGFPIETASGTASNYSNGSARYFTRESAPVGAVDVSDTQSITSAGLSAQALERQVQELQAQLAEERGKAQQELERVRNEVEERARYWDQDVKAKKSTIEILVSEKRELESKAGYLEQQCQLILGEKKILNEEIDSLKQTCQDLKSDLKTKTTNSDELEDLRKELSKTLTTLDTAQVDNAELQSKLTKVCEEQKHDKETIKHITSELEIAKVQLIQLRSSGLQESSGSQQQEINNLGQELQATRKSLSEALASRDKLAADRDKLAEQYRNYSKDLAMQAERLSEQLRRNQEENAKLVQRESTLVRQVENMEKQMQKYVQGGKNVTEEEISRLKDRCASLETELRQARDSRSKLEEMYNERSVHAEDIMKRLAHKEAKILELNANISSLETTVEMLKSDSGDDRTQFLAAMESDKVAASRAMQQNTQLKQDLEELQKEIINLNNTKAELLDKLEDSRLTVERLNQAPNQMEALQAAIREREVMIGDLRNQVKYYESELAAAANPTGEAGGHQALASVVGQTDASLTASLYTSTAGVNDAANVNIVILNLEKELQTSKEEVRSLNSINSELRSQIEVLSSRTTECSEERGEDSRSASSHSNRTRTSSGNSNDGAEGRSGDQSFMDQSTISSSSESFVEVKKMSHASSDSFEHLNQQQQVDGEPLTKSSLEVGHAEAPARPDVTQQQAQRLDPWEQLQARFIKAMDKVAALSSDKEQLEHLVLRLEEETETVHDYIIMYQHQRQQHKLRLKEKDEQLQQLARDRANLQAKISDLTALVSKIMKIDVKGPSSAPSSDIVQCDKPAEVKEDTVGDAADREVDGDPLSEAGSVEECQHAPTSSNNPDSKVNDDQQLQETTALSISSGQLTVDNFNAGDRERIRQLLSEIETQSDTIVTSMEKFEPWFFGRIDPGTSPIITV